MKFIHDEKQLFTLAKFHNHTVFAIMNESFKLTQKLSDGRGEPSMEQVLSMLSTFDSVPKSVRDFAKAVAQDAPQIEAAQKQLTEKDDAFLNKLDKALSAAGNAKDMQAVLEKMHGEVDPKSDYVVGLELGFAMIETGKSWIYDAAYLEKTFGLKQVEPGDKNHHGNKAQGRHSVGGVAVEDVKGAVKGGIGGAITVGVATWWAGSGPGAVAGGVGGAAGGAVLASGGAIWDWGKDWYGGGCNHCPGDPNGPIGQQQPDELPPEW